MNEEFVLRNTEVLNALNINWIWNETKGAGIKVAVIDTGIDVTHPDLKDNIKETYNSVTQGTEVYDTQGHGTHCAGVVAANGLLKGIAPECDLYIVKAFEGASTSLEAIARGIDWAVAKGVDVISMSLGSQSDSGVLNAAIQRAYDAGVICVCAAGNDAQVNTITIDYPAVYPTTLAVGAVDSQFNIATFSSTGEVDVVADGVDLPSCYLDGSYACMSGTSMATPIVAGAAVLYQANAKLKLGRKLTFHELKIVLAMNSIDKGDVGKDIQYGYGVFSF